MVKKERVQNLIPRGWEIAALVLPGSDRPVHEHSCSQAHAKCADGGNNNYFAVELCEKQAEIEDAFVQCWAALKTHGHCQTAKKNFDDKLRAASSVGDAVIANIGVWYGKAEQAKYMADVEYSMMRP